jgi:hypothetical protein
MFILVSLYRYTLSAVLLRESLKEQRKATEGEGTRQSAEDSIGESFDKETKIIEFNNEI